MEHIDAIVLKTSPYRETSLLVTLLTRERGVVRALAKGARRKTRQAQAAFEPLSRVRAALHLKSADALGNLGEVQLVEAWPWLRHDLERFAFAALGVEVAGALAALHPDDSAFFEEVCEYMNAMGKARRAGSLAIAMLLRLLHETGHPPILDIEEDATLPPMLVWDFRSARLFPPAVNPPAADIDSPARRSRPSAPRSQPRLGLTEPLLVPARLGPDLIEWMILVWQDHLGRKLNAARFVREMFLTKRE